MHGKTVVYGGKTEYASEGNDHHAVPKSGGKLPNPVRTVGSHPEPKRATHPPGGRPEGTDRHPQPEALWPQFRKEPPGSGTAVV